MAALQTVLLVRRLPEGTRAVQHNPFTSIGSNVYALSVEFWELILFKRGMAKHLMQKRIS